MKNDVTETMKGFSLPKKFLIIKHWGDCSFDLKDNDLKDKRFVTKQEWGKNDIK